MRNQTAEIVGRPNAQIRIGGITAMVFGMLAFLVAWMLFMADIRGTLLRLRRGEYTFDLSKAQIKKAPDYIGLHLASSAVAYLLGW